MTEKIIVNEERRPVTVLDTEGDSSELGTMISRVYEGENVQRHEFEGKDNKGGDRTYRLGPTTTAFKFVDHAEVMQPMFEKGYFLESLVLGRGGLNLHTIWTPEDAPLLDDPITYDREFWPNGIPGVKESVVVTSAIRPGKGIKYRRGLFRMICTNGLVSEILGLGHSFMNHANFNTDRLVEELWGDDVAIGEVPMGPMIGNAQGVRALGGFLRNYLEDEEAVGELPLFVKDQVSAFHSMPQWYTTHLVEQLFAMTPNTSKGVSVHALEVLNATTNAMNLGLREDDSRSSVKPLARMDSINKAVMNLSGALSL